MTMLTNFGHLLDRREARLFLKSLLWHPGVSRAKKSDHVGQWAGGRVTSSPTTTMALWHTFHSSSPVTTPVTNLVTMIETKSMIKLVTIIVTKSVTKLITINDNTSA